MSQPDLNQNDASKMKKLLNGNAENVTSRLPHASSAGRSPGIKASTKHHLLFPHLQLLCPSSAGNFWRPFGQLPASYR